MAVHRFDTATLPEQPWKNGGGSTREIVCSPPGAVAFDWRVSLARIADDGPFSRFDGVDRVIVLLHGAGVQLRGDAIEHRLDQPLQPFAFAGDAPLQARLIDGACDDFNVMVRRGVLRARVSVRHASTDEPASPRGLVYAAHGSWQVAGHGEVDAGCGLWWEGVGLALQATPISAAAVLLVVHVDAVSA